MSTSSQSVTLLISDKVNDTFDGMVVSCKIWQPYEYTAEKIGMQRIQNMTLRGSIKNLNFLKIS